MQKFVICHVQTLQFLNKNVDVVKNPLQIPPENRTFFSILLLHISDRPKPPISIHPTKKNNCMLWVK